MQIERKKFLWNTVSIILDDVKIIPAWKSKKYGSIVALSYSKLDLPPVFKVYSKPTLCIDLTVPEDKIIMGFNDTTRNEIRKTYKDARFEVKIGEPDAESYEMYKKFEYLQGRVPVSFAEISGTLFVGVMFEGQLISGLYVTKSLPYLRIRSIFSRRLTDTDKEMYKNIAYGTRRVVLEACQWGKQNGYQSLDMASVNIHNPKTESIAKFKMSFGKDLTPEYTYIYKSKTFAFFEKLVVIKVFFKKIMYKILKNKL